MRRTLAPWIAVVALTVGCSSPQEAKPQAPLEPFHLGAHTRKISTSKPEAQRAFERGLTYAFAFAHNAAEEEFTKAAEIDPRCAMAYWGIALVNGPHINFPLVPPDKAAKAWDALTKARGAASGASAVERALIDALGARYAEHQPDDRHPLDVAYADAMRTVWLAHPEDADVATLFAESMMDLRPWDLWTPDGKPQPGTDEIVTTLERALALDPAHPGANHLYIHVVEASPDPARGVPAADRLRELVPGASHLVHMPSHIYARVGRWDDAAEANRRAMASDDHYRSEHPRPGFYSMYMAHNDHFYAFASMMQGRSADTISAARKMIATVPDEFLTDYGPIADGFMVFIPEALMRFGRWDEILAEPAPHGGLELSTALWHQTRAVALNALGRAAEARKERTLFEEASKNVPADRTFGNNQASDILSIASMVLDGEMAAKAGKTDDAIRLLGEAVRVEDGLRYDEPPDWMQPVRHTLGAVLLGAGKLAEAETVYREDLARYPENGWALFGLGRALRLEKKDAEAEAAEARFKKVWARADVELGSTCFCQPPA